MQTVTPACIDSMGSPYIVALPRTHRCLRAVALDALSYDFVRSGDERPKQSGPNSSPILGLNLNRSLAAGSRLAERRS